MKKPPLIKKLTTRFQERRSAKKMREQGIAFKCSDAATSQKPTHLKDDNITVILNAYKRPGYMPQQVAALRRQTAPPTQIWIWCNNSGEAMPDFSDIADRVVISNFNWKFFGRFALANLATTTYVALFDDDILPQPCGLKIACAPSATDTMVYWAVAAFCYRQAAAIRQRKKLAGTENILKR